jgi:hypothetical protein
MSNSTFAVLVLIGRPASGKSEIIDFLRHTPPAARLRRFHLAGLDVLDDFPLLWTWFEEDRLLSEEYHKRRRDDPHYHDHTTTLVEFARGSEHGGYTEAFAHLSDDLLRQAAVVYVQVSFAESRRKNRRRFNPERPDSILEHAMTDEVLTRLYREDDWATFSAGDPHFLTLRSLRLPYVVFENEDDVTTGQPALLAARLEAVLGQLWTLRQAR